jgi:bile acid:Na+ symporter, BASS family
MKIVQLVALVMIVSTMLGAGLQVDWEKLKGTARSYGLLARALLANFILVPLFAWLLVTGLHVEGDVSIGILLMAMAPGVPFLVNSAGRKQGGSLSFALEIAFLFSALSILTIPLTAELLLPADALAAVPAQKFLTTLVLFQLVPLVAGALLAPRLEASLVARSVKALHWIFLVATIVLIVLIFPKVVSSIASVYGLGHLLEIAAVGLFSAVAGWFLGGPERTYRRTLSIATLMRNIGLCALIGESSFADTLVVPTVIAYTLITFALSLPFRVYYQRTAKSAAPA